MTDQNEIDYISKAWEQISIIDSNKNSFESKMSKFRHSFNLIPIKEQLKTSILNRK